MWLEEERGHNNMKRQWMKRSTSLMLGLSLLLPAATASAADGEVYVKVRLTGLEGSAAERFVRVGQETYVNGSGDKVKLTTPTALGALVEVAKEAGVSYALKSSSFGDYVYKIGTRAEKDLNANTGWSAWINGAPLSVGADKAAVKGGDTVVWGFQDWTQTLFPKVEFSTKTPRLGSPFTVKVTAEKTTYDANWNPKVERVLIEGASLKDGSGKELAKTNGEGVATLTPAQSGLLALTLEKKDAQGLPLLVDGAAHYLRVTAPQASFRDIQELGWSTDAIMRLAAAGIVQGGTSGLFEPKRALMRSELAKMVTMIKGSDFGLNAAGDGFADVAQDSASRLFIDTASREGLMSGDASAGRFRPDAPVTREELAVVLVRLAGAEGKLDAKARPSFLDTPAASYSLPYVAYAQQLGLLKGDGYGHFRFTAPVTRAEAAVALMSFTNKE